MKIKRVLVVSSESTTRRYVRDILISEAHVTIEARTMEEALDECTTGRIDLTLLDVSLSGIDGFEVCKRIRQASDTPIILLLAESSTEKDLIQASSSGATEFLVRPFRSDQLISRVGSTVRAEPAERELLEFESPNLRIDFACRRVVINNRSIRLTPKELELLRHLVMNEGRPVSHGKLLEALWGSGDSHHIGHLRVCVNQLRKKIEPRSKGPRHSLIRTDNFIGYHFEPNPHGPASTRSPNTFAASPY